MGCRSTLKKIFAIGDIHGMKDEAVALIESLPIAEQDLVIFLGDYIDRGYDSKGVVEYLLWFREKHPNTIFLRGNHEDMFLSFIEEEFSEEIYFYNGGEKTLKSYGIPPSQYHYAKRYIPLSHLNFLKSLPLYHETEDYIFVHAGLRPGVPLYAQDPEDLLWIRYEFIYSKEDFGKRVIFGHTAFKEPLIMKNKIGIDTGLVYGGKLTALELPDLKFYHNR